MKEPVIATRLVFHVGGYDPMPPARMYARFLREMPRFERTWSATISVSDEASTADETKWNVLTVGPNWRVETHYKLVRWDDVMARHGSRRIWWRVLYGLLAFVDFVAGGALWGYARTNWRYALFFLYPYLLLGIVAALAWVFGALIGRTFESVPFGIVAGVAALFALLQGPGRWLYLPLALDDWIFSRTYIRQGDPILNCRLDRVAGEIVEAARGAEADEILIVGHSLGAVLAIDLLDRALRLDPDLGRGKSRVALATVGSSILKIGLHRGAVRFRAALARVASASVFWVEYQCLTDVMNFYKTDPVAESGLSPTGRPVVRIVRIRNMLNPAYYRSIRRNFFRVHNQFVSGNELRAAYDYFMMVCGPLSAERQANLPNGAPSAMDEGGKLLESESDLEEQPAQ